MRLISPHRSLMFATVTGTPDATYQASWLVDGRGNYPLKKTGAFSFALAKSPAQDVDVIAVCLHNIRAAATISLTGDVTNTIPTSAHPSNAIPHNWFRLLTAAVSVDALTIAITGNVDPITIGELYAGLSWEPESGLKHGRSLSPGEVLQRLGEHGLTMPFDDGVSAPRGMSGELALTSAEFAELKDMHAAQRNGSRPCLFIPDDTINDAWLCVFNFTEQTTGGTHFVSIEFMEIPRIRW